MFGVFKRNQDGTEELVARSGDWLKAHDYADSLNEDRNGPDGATYQVKEVENASNAAIVQD